MTATLDAPVCTVPLPPGARAQFFVPAPDKCGGECAVEWRDPDFEAPCDRCGGSGLEPAYFRLPPARAHKYRAVRYEPGRKRLVIETAVQFHTKLTAATYSVVEVPCDGPGRCFVVAKLGTLDRTHHTYVGPDGVRCSCEGETYQTSAKHNQRAHEAGEAVYPTYGCVHADACEALLRAGWFDL